MATLQEAFRDNLARIKNKNNINFERLAVGVSGGADSLALVFLLHNYAKENQLKMLALTVNHHLRAEADAEAQYVHNLLQDYGIEHHILDWQSNNPKSGIEEKAREARYGLLENWCFLNDYQFLLTAHHQKDQAETFLMRLQRGSGVDGLAAMSEFSQRGKIKIIRPLLNVDPDELKKFLNSYGVNWINDASNECDDFLRVRIRKMLPSIESEMGISVKRIADTAAALGSVKEYFEEQVEKYLKANVRFWDDLAVSFFPKNFNFLHPELKIRILGYLLKKIGRINYPPSYLALVRLCDVLQNEDFKGCTLGGCEIVRFQKKIWIIHEQGPKQLLLKSKWEDFLRDNPKYKDQILPYQLKIILVNGSQL